MGGWREKKIFYPSISICTPAYPLSISATFTPTANHLTFPTPLSVRNGERHFFLKKKWHQLWQRGWGYIIGPGDYLPVTLPVLVSDAVSRDFSGFTASFHFNLPLFSVFFPFPLLYILSGIYLHFVFVLKLFLWLYLGHSSQYLNVCVSFSLTAKYISKNFFFFFREA